MQLILFKKKYVKKNIDFRLFIVIAFFIFLSNCTNSLTSKKLNQESIETTPVLSPTENIKTAQLMVTLSTTNEQLIQYPHFRLGLYDIIAYIKSGDNIYQQSLYNKRPIAETDFNDAMDLELTQLSKGVSLYQGTHSIPEGKIVFLHVQFSGTQSSIIVDDTQPVLIDPFFFQYGGGDIRTPKRYFPTEVMISPSEDISIDKGTLQIIDINIDMNLSSLKEPFAHSNPAINYVLFSPFIKVNALSPPVTLRLQSNDLIKLTSSHLSIGNTIESDLFFNTSYSLDKESRLAIDGDNLAELGNLSGLFYIDITGKLTTPNSQPHLSIEKASLATITADSTASIYKGVIALTDDGEVSLKGNRFDLSTLASSTFYAGPIPRSITTDFNDGDHVTLWSNDGESKLIEGHHQSIADNHEDMFELITSIYLAPEDVLSIKNAEKSDESIILTLNEPLQCEDFVFTIKQDNNTKTARTNCTDPINYLLFSPNNVGDFSLLETRKGEIIDSEDEGFASIELAPDHINHYAVAKDFFTALELKVTEGYRLTTFVASGYVDYDSFKISNNVKAILLHPQPSLDTTADNFIQAVEENGEIFPTGNTGLNAKKITLYSLIGLASTAFTALTMYGIIKARNHYQKRIQPLTPPYPASMTTINTPPLINNTDKQDDKDTQELDRTTLLSTTDTRDRTDSPSIDTHSNTTQKNTESPIPFPERTYDPFTLSRQDKMTVAPSATKENTLMIRYYNRPNKPHEFSEYEYTLPSQMARNRDQYTFEVKTDFSVVAKRKGSPQKYMWNEIKKKGPWTTRWFSRPGLRAWMNDIQDEVVLIKPNGYPTFTTGAAVPTLGQSFLSGDVTVGKKHTYAKQRTPEGLPSALSLKYPKHKLWAYDSPIGRTPDGLALEGRYLLDLNTAQLDTRSALYKKGTNLVYKVSKEQPATHQTDILYLVYTENDKQIRLYKEKGREMSQINLGYGDVRPNPAQTNPNLPRYYQFIPKKEGPSLPDSEEGLSLFHTKPSSIKARSLSYNINKTLKKELELLKTPSRIIVKTYDNYYIQVNDTDKKNYLMKAIINEHGETFDLSNPPKNTTYSIKEEEKSLVLTVVDKTSNIETEHIIINDEGNLTEGADIIVKQSGLEASWGNAIANLKKSEDDVFKIAKAQRQKQIQDLVDSEPWLASRAAMYTVKHPRKAMRNAAITAVGAAAGLASLALPYYLMYQSGMPTDTPELGHMPTLDYETRLIPWGPGTMPAYNSSIGLTPLPRGAHR